MYTMIWFCNQYDQLAEPPFKKEKTDEEIQKEKYEIKKRQELFVLKKTEDVFILCFN